ncbi:MAG TPA: hypothetical protein VGL44_05280 [Gaiellales bacterium]|jgi:hypothetical protein
MNGSDDDIRWVSAQRPAIDPPDAVATSQARAELLRHAARSARLAPVAAAPSAARPRRRRIAVLARPRRGIAMAAAAAVVAAACITAALAVAPRLGHDGINTAIAPGVAKAQTLVLLANHIALAPRRGDATLVFHRNAIRGEGTFTGADLYLDNGRYYYAMTRAGLPAAIKAGPQDFSLKPIVDAMASVSSADPSVARAAFLKAADPLYGGDIQHGPTAEQDNVIWVSGVDVLGAAYGRPAVLAGVLRALATVHGVTVTHTTFHGVRTLDIAMKVPAQTVNLAAMKRALAARIKAMGHLTKAEAAVKQKLDAQSQSAPKTIPAHFMRLTLNARTGGLMRYTDVGLVVTYHVTRVNAARLGGR